MKHDIPTQDRQQLIGLLSDRAGALNAIALLRAEVEGLEARISEIIATANGPVRVPGFVTLCLTALAVSERFDPDTLRDLIQSLRETGNEDIANEIARCKKQSARAGGLRITPSAPASSRTSFGCNWTLYVVHFPLCDAYDV